MMQVWIVGKGNVENHLEWEFQGVFDSQYKATRACKGWNWFIAPAEINQELPEETIEWAGLIYPITR